MCIGTCIVCLAVSESGCSPPGSVLRLGLAYRDTLQTMNHQFGPHLAAASPENCYVSEASDDMNHETSQNLKAAPVEKGYMSEALDDMGRETSPEQKAAPVEEGYASEASDDMDQASLCLS